MKKTYYGNYMTAEGTHVRPSYKDTNKAKLARDMRAVAKGSCLAGSTATWAIADENGNVILSGVIRK